MLPQSLRALRVVRRSLFHLFFTHSLLRETARVGGLDAAREGLATIYVVTLIAENLYGRVTRDVVLGLGGDILVPLAFTVIRGLLLVQAQQEIDRALDVVAPARDRNGRVGIGLAIFLGVLGLLWALVLFGYAVGLDEP